MTNSQPDRLDRITDKLDSLADLLIETAGRTLNNEQNIAELSANGQRQQLAIDALIEAQRNQQETTTSILNSIAVMQSEIRGLQTENRRILDRLLGEETDENN
jgi:hypothetical protein